jgi:hypothetical protein
LRGVCGETADSGSELREAAGQGDVDRMVSCLEKTTSVVKEQPNAEGLRPLHWAARAGQVEAVLALMQLQLDVNAPAGNGESIRSWWGAAPSELEAQRALFALKVEMDEVFPARAGQPLDDFVRALLLVEAGSKPHPPTSARGGTPLHFAAQCGHVETVNALVEAGADVHAHDAEGRRPLHWAEEGHVEAMSLLGVDTAAPHLQMSIHAGHHQVAQLLRELEPTARARQAAAKERAKQAAEQDIAEKREAADRVAAEILEEEEREEAAKAQSKVRLAPPSPTLGSAAFAVGW